MGKQYKWESWSDLLKLRDFVVLDVETTGLSNQKEKIIEIGLLKIANGSIVDEFSSLVNPGKNIPAKITELTGITQNDVADAPTFQEIADRVKSFIGSNMVMAHSATFDVGFLEKEFSLCGIKVELEYFDTLALAKKALPDLESHSLEALVQHMNIPAEQSHRALDDAKSAFRFFCKVQEHYDRPLARAIAACCKPIVDYRVKDVGEHPLAGKHFSLAGEFTFSHSTALKLITTAGGVVDPKATEQTDFLVYGYIEGSSGLPAHQYAQPINEVRLLKMCGAELFS